MKTQKIKVENITKFDEILIEDYGKRTVLDTKVNANKTISIKVQMKFAPLSFNYVAGTFLQKIV